MTRVPWSGRRQPAGTAAAPDASVIIPVFNRADMTEGCLNALAHHPPAVAHEVIVIDNGSTDETQGVLQRFSGAVRTFRNASNLGFAVACNQGAAAARGRHLVFLNNDTLPEPGWLEELVRVADTEAHVGAVGCKILSWDGTRIHHAGVVLCDHPSLPILCHYLYRGAPRDFPAANKRRDFNVVTAACMLVLREAFARAGGFCPDYRNGFEDVDLCFRLRRLGYRIVYAPGAVIRHFEHASPGRQRHDRDNYDLLCRRWAGQFPADIRRYLLEDGYDRDPFSGLGGCPANRLQV